MKLEPQGEIYLEVMYTPTKEKKKGNHKRRVSISEVPHSNSNAERTNYTFDILMFSTYAVVYELLTVSTTALFALLKSNLKPAETSFHCKTAMMSSLLV